MSLIVRIFQHDFPIDREYTEGHTITEGEAAALNQLLVENIRNNVTGWVTRAAKGQSVLSAEDHEELRARIAEYGANYQFKARTRSRPLNPLEATSNELARQYAENWGNSMGLGVNSPGVYAKYLELKSDPKILEEARQLILRRQTVVNQALEGIF
jgi:hypothetical protein